MKKFVAFLRERIAEPSTRAGAAAALGVVATVLATSGFNRAAMGGVLGAALLSAVSAMVKADPKVASVVEAVAAISPELLLAAEALSPSAAPFIGELASEIQSLGGQVGTTPTASTKHVA